MNELKKNFLLYWQHSFPQSKRKTLKKEKEKEKKKKRKYSLERGRCITGLA